MDITPHQLRHSCATLLLNAGAPVLSVQSLLVLEKLDTTLGYARLYDGTIAADYYRAMNQVERLFHLPESRRAPFYTPAELVAWWIRWEVERSTIINLRQCRRCGRASSHRK